MFLKYYYLVSFSLRSPSETLTTLRKMEVWCKCEDTFLRLQAQDYYCVKYIENSFKIYKLTK